MCPGPASPLADRLIAAVESEKTEYRSPVVGEASFGRGRGLVTGYSEGAHFHIPHHQGQLSFRLRGFRSNLLQFRRISAYSESRCQSLIYLLITFGH